MAAMLCRQYSNRSPGGHASTEKIDRGTAPTVFAVIQSACSAPFPLELLQSGKLIFPERTVIPCRPMPDARCQMAGPGGFRNSSRRAEETRVGQERGSLWKFRGVRCILQK